MYQSELTKKDNAAKILQDCLVMLSTFCHSMPLDWFFGASAPDFISALLYMLREPLIQTEAITCLEQLALRKLDSKQWMMIVRKLPAAIQEANDQTHEHEELQVEKQVGGGNTITDDPLTRQLKYHRCLSKMLAGTVSTNISHITTEKQIVSGSTNKVFARAKPQI